ncbi:phosphotransferase [Paenibacillus sp. TRM 82003]|nr:phosphotransferase [Paenibacillus sp. TRM 82003]
MKSVIGKKLGEGGCSEVYEWQGTQHIVKIGKPNTSFEAMRQEFENTLAVWENGLPATRPVELLEIDRRPAIVFERIDGESLMERFVAQMTRLATSGGADAHTDSLDITARLLSKVHEHSNLRLPSQREMLIGSIRSSQHLTLSEKEEVIRRLQLLPRKERVCHGDPNPGNILFHNGEGVLIDWMNASIGNPEADAAEYIIMVRHAVLPDHLPSAAVQAFDAVRENVVRRFCEEYRLLTGISYEEIEPWIVPVAARKLSADGIGEAEKDALAKEIRSRF